MKSVVKSVGKLEETRGTLGKASTALPPKLRGDTYVLKIVRKLCRRSGGMCMPTLATGDHHTEADAFSFSARRNLTIAIVSRAQYCNRASLILACSIQSSSTNTMR